MALDKTEKGHFTGILAPSRSFTKELHDLMQNKSSSIVAELEKSQCNGVEMRNLNDMKKDFGHVLFNSLLFYKIHLGLQSF